MPSNVQTRSAPLLYVLIYFAGFLTACLWFNPQDYLSDLAPTVTAVAALTAVWLVCLLVMYKVRSQTEWMQREQRIQREQIHPVLHAAIRRMEGSPATLVLSVKNHGKGAAGKVRFHIEALPNHAASNAVTAAASRLPVFSDGLDMLAAGETYSGAFADVEELTAQLPPNGLSGVVKLRLEYQNTFGETCKSENVLELAGLNRAV